MRNEQLEVEASILAETIRRACKDNLLEFEILTIREAILDAITDEFEIEII